MDNWRHVRVYGFVGDGAPLSCKKSLKTQYSMSNKQSRTSLSLKGLFHPAYLARVVSCLAFAVAIVMGNENGDSKGQPRDGSCKACWM